MKIENFPQIYPSMHTEKINNFFSFNDDYNNRFAKSDIDFKDKIECAFFICFTNRCGSNFVAQAISSDGCFPEAGEYFNFDTVIDNSNLYSIKSFGEYFSWLVRHVLHDNKYFGCKISPEQLLLLYNNNFFSYFKIPPRIIHVVRNDVIAQAVSLYIASKRNIWTSEQPSSNFVPISYDKNQLISIVSNIAMQNSSFDAIFKLIGFSSIRVTYEDFIANPDDGLIAISDYFGVKNLKFIKNAVKIKKQSDDLNSNFISLLQSDLKLTYPPV